MKTHIGHQSLFLFYFFYFCLYYRSDPHFYPVPELASFDSGAEHNRFVLETIQLYTVSNFDLARTLHFSLPSQVQFLRGGVSGVAGV